MWCLPKSQRSCPNIGLYNPLLVLNTIWDGLSIDFIIGLPLTKRRTYSIFVAMDIFYKMVHFSPCKEVSGASYVATLFFEIVVRLHGIPKSITAD